MLQALTMTYLDLLDSLLAQLTLRASLRSVLRSPFGSLVTRGQLAGQKPIVS